MHPDPRVDILTFMPRPEEARLASENLDIADRLRAAVQAGKPIGLSLPVIRLPKERLDLGTVDQGMPLRAEFEVENLGAGELRYTVTPDCSCFNPVPDGKVASQGRAKVRLGISTQEYVGQQNKMVLLRSNDPLQPSIEIPVTFRSRPAYRLFRPGGDKVADIRRHACLKGDRDIRVLGHECPQGSGKHVGRQGRKASNPELARPVVPDACRGPAQMGEAHESLLHLTEKQLPFGRRLKTPFDAAKEIEAQRAFEFLDHLADGGLRHVKDFGGARRCAVGHDDPEDLDLSEIHVASRRQAITIQNSHSVRMADWEMASRRDLGKYRKAATR
ncbi:MAG: DUF1573 domain-containing protein [Verrucomicrobiaceae bacterium]|nr:MAG: DUF1573 domain-containing protein [Verrucomicrobiaceae bacterium]